MKLYFKFLAVLAPFVLVLSAGADDTFPTLKANGSIYTNVTVTAVTATDIYFSYEGGMGNVKLESLSPELQEHFHYNAANAAAQEKQQALANAGYLAYRAQRWERDLPEALARAGSENKHVLMEFAGSEWHGRSMKLEQEVFATCQFAYYAQSNLVLLRIEFPHDDRGYDHLRRANDQLAGRFNVNVHPTCILLDSSGRELGRQVGYPEGGPAAFMAWLEGFGPPAVQPPATTTLGAIASVTPPAATTQVTAFVTRLNAVMVPKFGPKWYLIACIPSSLVLLFLTLRRIGKARQNL
jgi:Thioredoxin-like